MASTRQRLYCLPPLKKHVFAPAAKSRGKRGHEGTSRAVSSGPKHVQKDSALRKLFGIDPRSLAVFRVAISAVLLADLAIRAADLRVMYTDDGMFSRAEICRHYTSIWNWSFHFASGSWAYQATLFGLAAVLGLALLAGYQTRVAVVGSWLMAISIQHRVPPILSGAEILLRMLVFWAMFLPLERAWSLDAWLRRRKTPTAARIDQAQVVSVASAAIMLQVGMVYFFSAVLKSNIVWIRGEALSGILAHDFYASPLAANLLGFPRLLTCLTWAAFLSEWLAVFLLFAPRRTATLRLAGIALLSAMHLCIGLVMEVGLFSYVSLAGLTLFVPEEFWKNLLARFRRVGEALNQLSGGSRHLEEKDSPFLIARNICLILLLIFVFLININGLESRPLASLGIDKWKPLTLGSGLGQRWGMFETIPANDGWYVGRAKLRDGTEVDLLQKGKPLNWSRPKYPAEVYPNHFWQKLFVQMSYDNEFGMQVFREPVARFLCRSWNAQNIPEKSIAEFEFIFCRESEIDPPRPGISQIVREQLIHLDLNDP
jgi:hypothetical protein